MTADVKGRMYAKLEELKPGDTVQVDDGFEGCFIPWSIREVVMNDNELSLIHNTVECGACGGNNNAEDCFHDLDGQLNEDGYLIGIYTI